MAKSKWISEFDKIQMDIAIWQNPNGYRNLTKSKWILQFDKIQMGFEIWEYLSIFLVLGILKVHKKCGKYSHK